MKLILASLLATLVAAASLAAVAKSASTAQTIRVTELSYSIRFSAKPKAGTVKFVVKNASGDDHDFVLRGGGKTVKTRVLGGLSSAILTAKLNKNVRYTFWCAVDDHRSEGMSGSFVAR